MESWFENIFDGEKLKENVQFASLFVLNYECLKNFIVTNVREFFSDISIEEGELKFTESNSYKTKVRKLDKHVDNASLKWFIEQNAISETDYQLYQKIRGRRNDITHEFLKNIMEGFSEEDMYLFLELQAIYQKLDRWWINEIEIPISGDDVPSGYDNESVLGGESLIVSAINDIILLDKGDEYKEILNTLEEYIKKYNAKNN